MGERNPRLTTSSQPVHPRFILGLSPGPQAIFVPGCKPVYRRLSVYVNPFHARHIRKFFEERFILRGTPLFSEERFPSIFQRTPLFLLRRTPAPSRNHTPFSKNPLLLRRTPSIFDLRSRRSNNPHLESSIFETESRRPPIFIGRVEDRTEMRWEFLHPKNEESNSFSYLFGRRTNDLPPLSTFLAGMMGEEIISLVFLLPTPLADHQFLSATLKSGFLDRSSTLKIDPNIGIGSLFLLYNVQ